MYKLVRESVFNDSYYENKLFESLNEGFNLSDAKNLVSKIKDKNQAAGNLIKKFKETNFNGKKLIGTVLILLILSNLIAKNNKWAGSREFHKELEKASIELASNEDLTIEEVKNTANKIIELEGVTVTATANKEIFSVADQGLIKAINNVVPGRLSSAKIPQYDKYDDAILKACENLKAKGEKPDANLIKAIMIIETGMNPRINHKGFQGFPQTKKHLIDGWKDKDGTYHPGINKKFGTNFTIEDMYDAEKSAEFIYYYVKGLKKSIYVKTVDDVIIAYNWGMGNLGKYKRGEVKLPNESANYVKMMKVLQKYFS